MKEHTSKARAHKLKLKERIQQLETFIRSRSCGKCKGKNTSGVCEDCVVNEILSQQS